MSIKSGQLLNKENLNAAFLSKTENNSIIGDISTLGNISSVNITASGILSGSALSTSNNAIIGGTLTVDSTTNLKAAVTLNSTLTVAGALTASSGINIPTGQTYKVNGVALTATYFNLGNVTNESKSTMFSGAALTGIPTAPTASVATNTTQIATTAYVKSQGYMTGLFSDTTPKLGGNLDVNGKTITTTIANGSIVLTSLGAGTVNATTDFLASAKLMIGNTSTYFNYVATNTITTPNSIKMASNSTALYFGTNSDASIKWGGTGTLQLGDGTATDVIVPAGRLGVNNSSPGTTLDVGTAIGHTIRSYGGYVGNATANIDSTGAAAYFPSGVYINGTTQWIYGSITFNGAQTGATTISASSTITAATFNATTIGGFEGVDADTILRPSFTWSGDKVTGMWHAATAAIGFTTAGVNRVTISNTGLSAIGTISSIGNMYVNGNEVYHTGNLKGMIIKRQEFTATANQTIFTLTTGNYDPGKGYISVFLWGSKQPSNSYLETSSTRVTLSAGVPVGTKVMLEWFEGNVLLKGEKGDAGTTGEQGQRGLQGIQGIQGIPGVKGETGSKGDPGEQGQRGLQGIQGIQGIPGAKGETGSKGDPGEQGTQGLQGIQGVKGETGSISNLNSTHIATALGYYPANELHEHTHTNKATIDKFTEVNSKPYYNGAEIGGAVPNLTLSELILGGRFKIVYNDIEDSLDIEVI